ncbi:MAG TPA: tetratricopeptide repeat protein, partial [Gemmataceae bacterium]|nr:tetratricopeptide repeat protein [Gemmataceae bacterium]
MKSRASVSRVAELGSFFALAALAFQPYAASWQNYTDLGQKALREGHYRDAESLFRSALQEASGFDAHDSRLATSFDNLAWLYYKEGKYAEALPLCQRALATRELDAAD